MKVLLVVAGLLAVSLAQVSPLLKALENRIAGGEVTAPHEFPYQAGLFIQLKPQYEGQENKVTIWCGGSIISKDYVITAAHCLRSGEVAVVFIGAHKIWGVEHERQMIGVSYLDWTIHPKYDDASSENDIALIKLSKPITFNKTAQPISLPRRSQKSDDLLYRLATITGWGRTGDQQPTSDVLRVLYRRIKDASDCKITYGSLFLDSNVCVDGSYGRSVCPGDSGGPLALELDGTKTLIGLTSFGRKQGCELGYPTAFTRVSSYLDWIHSVTGIAIRD